MNSRTIRLACTCAAALVLAACATSDGGGYGGMSREETIGTAGGAVAGGLAGYAISGGAVGALIGAAAGGLIGNRLGNWLEGDGDQAAARAAESGQRVTWQKTGTTFETTQKGWATPAGPAYTAGDGRTCRPIRQSATQGEETREDTVTLCKGSSGWAPA